jgi:hypothetical protein
MAEWPDELLAGLDAPRPLGAGLQRRLEEALLVGDAPLPGRPLGDELEARLEGTLLEDDDSDVAAALAGIDAPRPLPASTRAGLAMSLAGRRRRWVPVGAAAASLVLLAGVGVVLAQHASPPTSTAERSSAPHRASAGTSASGGAGSTSQSSAGAASAAKGPTALAAPGRVDAIPAPDLSAVSVAGLSPDRGPAGTVVTVRGHGFSGATVVRFGSVDAVFSVVSDFELRATAPPGAGTVDVLVTTPAGTSGPQPWDRYSYTS